MAAGSGAGESASGLAVLVVDDDELMRAHLAAVLESAGFAMHAAASGREALTELDRTGCRIVVADWEMSDMDGITLCRTIRRRQRTDYVYILMLTVRESARDLLAGFEAGADDYLVKGVPDDEIVARLNSGRRIISHLGVLARNAAYGEEPGTEPASRVRDGESLQSGLAQDYHRCRRMRVPIAILACEIDDLERATAQFGAAVASELANIFRTEVAKLLLDSDWIVRTEQGTFVVVLPSTNLEGARVVGEKICGPVAALLNSAGALGLTVSVGAAALDDPQRLELFAPADLQRCAQACLRQSQRFGQERLTARLVTRGEG